MGKSDGEELVRYMTEQFVAYLEKPKEERRAQKLEKRKTRENWSLMWFGMLPVTLSVWLKRISRRNHS